VGLCHVGDVCSAGGNWEYPLWAWQAGKRINRHHYIRIIAVESASVYIICNAWEISHSFKIIKSGINPDARQRLPNYYRIKPSEWLQHPQPLRRCGISPLPTRGRLLPRRDPGVGAWGHQGPARPSLSTRGRAEVLSVWLGPGRPRGGDFGGRKVVVWLGERARLGRGPRCL